MSLKEYEVVCDKCRGTGDDLSYVTFGIPCKKCGGSGKVDWVENVVGKKIPILKLKLFWVIK